VMLPDCGHVCVRAVTEAGAGFVAV